MVESLQMPGVVKYQLVEGPKKVAQANGTVAGEQKTPGLSNGLCQA